MIKKLTVVLFFSCLILIGAIKLPSSRFGTFNSYMRNFVEAGRSVGVDVDLSGVNIMFLWELPHDAAGLCHTSTKTVVILKPYWDKINESERETLIFHELGHCVLGKDHNNLVNLDGHPRSIMYFSNVIGEDELDYMARRPQYINELFGK